LRAGLNPQGAYTVSFVYLTSGARFAKAGAYEMTLPKLDIPVNLLTWEVSLPDRLEVRQFGGNALSAELFPAAAQTALANNIDDLSENENYVFSQNGVDISKLEAGQIGGIVADANGAVVPNATVTVVNTQTGARQTTRSDGDGRWVVSGVAPGPTSVNIESPGFRSARQELEVATGKPARLGTTLDVGAASETVTIIANGSRSNNTILDGVDRVDEQVRKNQAAQQNAPSQNVFALQRRVAGILPVRVEVPRSGKAYRFVRPLVMEEETSITFQYKSR
jgi:hypothetical protein